jgi:hypothetical protein
MMSDRSPLLNFLADRRSADHLDPQGWSLLFAEARACSLSARLATTLAKAPPASMPAAFHAHLLAAQRQWQALADDAIRELRLIAEALHSVGTRVVLLKGAAYVAADLPSAQGRIFSDIDVLVDKEFLPKAEGNLMLAGWVARHMSAYDHRYYREWSHEIPPMMHLQRGTVIDLHHSLVMPTCKIRVDVKSMIDDIVPIPGEGNWFRLKDEDLVLHAASHLLLNSEFDRGLRDLWDIDLLMRYFSADMPDFGEAVLHRAERVGLGRVVRQAFTLCARLFRTPLPQRALNERGPVMKLLGAAIDTRHPDTRSSWQALADQLLLYRELNLRLPPALLARHLWHKATTAFHSESQRRAV